MSTAFGCGSSSILEYVIAEVIHLGFKKKIHLYKIMQHFNMQSGYRENHAKSDDKTNKCVTVKVIFKVYKNFVFFTI